MANEERFGLYKDSRFGLEIDFKASHGAYLHDMGRGREFLDFFGNYSSHALGYSSRNLVVPFAKIANCEVKNQEVRDLARKFKYPYVLFCNSGGLAVDAAVKTALTQLNEPVYSFKKSYHGTTGYGLTLTDRSNPKTINYPKFDWPQLERTDTNVRGNVIVEPIQCTYGDLYRPKEWFKEIRKKSDILIFDEVQTGFGATGTMWYYEQLGIEPDIVTFGKKAQISGVLSKYPIPADVEVTFDGTIDDVKRCTQVLKDYDDFDLLTNARERGKQLLDGIEGSWGMGVLVAMPGDHFMASACFAHGLLVNETVNNTIRLRPPMNVTEAECDHAIQIISEIGRVYGHQLLEEPTN